MNIDFNKNDPLKPGLYIVSTPIGNLEDITIRAIRTLHSVDCILCEDTRMTSKLLSKYGIKKKLLIYNDFSNNKNRDKICEEIEQGKSLALVSDAGTPLISDPGYKLVQQLQQHSLFVTAVPGACAAINALVLSGAQSDRFKFHGFLPVKGKEREFLLKEILASDNSSIIYETSKKFSGFAKDLIALDPEKEIIVVREMTKIFEEATRDKIKNLTARSFRGELVIVIPGKKSKADIEINLDPNVIKIIKNLSTKDGQKILQLIYPELKKNDAYNLLK